MQIFRIGTKRIVVCEPLLHLFSKKTSWLLLLLLLLQFIIIIDMSLFSFYLYFFHEHPNKNSLHWDCTFQMLLNVGSCCRKVCLYTLTVQNEL